jgi:hypothetical protein
MQYGGGNCALCGSLNTTKATCPLNKNAKNVNTLKHPNASKPKTASVKADKSPLIKPAIPKATLKTRKLRIVRPKNAPPKVPMASKPKTASVKADKSPLIKPVTTQTKKIRHKTTRVTNHLKKERKTLLNKNPPLKTAYISFLEKHNIKFGTAPLGSGTFADVYDIGDNKVLRVEASTYMNRYAEARRRINNYLIDNDAILSSQYKIYPRIYSFDVKTSLTGPSDGWVMAVIMEKLEMDSWTNWPSYFSTPEKLIEEFKKITKIMHKIGIIHTDISVNNVVLTTSGEIIFIDVDDSCMLPGCSEAPGRTLGYQGPEWALSGSGQISGKYRTAMKETIAEWGINPDTLPKQEDFLRGKYDEAIKKNTIYGMGALLYHIFTGKNPAHKIHLADVHPAIKNMLHPDMRQRSLE